MPVMNIYKNVLIHGDGEIATAEPERRFVDWKLKVEGVLVTKPDSRQYYVDPGASMTVFSGSRVLTADSSSAYDLTLNTTQQSTYRMTSTAGTAPGFRTARAVALNGEAVSLAVNNNTTVDVTLDSLSSPTFASVQVGDTVFIPDVSTGDAATVFSPLNVGTWVVLAKGAVSSVPNKKLTLSRPTGTAFEGVTESAVVTADSQFLVFSAAGVQVEDSLEISAGFSSVSQKTFVISRVTSDWIEFVSTENLPLEAGIIPDVSGLSVYTNAKRFVHVETDQEALVRLNGDTGSFNRMSPRIVGDIDQMAHFEMWGSCWRLDVVNRSTSTPMVVNVISCE